MRLPRPEQLSHPDQWHLYRHELTDYYGEHSLSKLKYTIHVRIVEGLVRQALDGGVGSLAVLDVGCAQGFFVIRLAESGCFAVGVDINPAFVAYARLKDDAGKCHFVCGCAYKLPFESRVFDLVILGEILEHLAEPEVLIREGLRVLKDSGSLLVTTPNGGSLLSGLPGYETSRDRTDMLQRQCGPDAGDHLFLFRPSELSRLLEREQARIVRRKFGKTWLFNTFTFALLGRLRPGIVFLADRFLTISPIGRWTGENLFLIARKANRLSTEASARYGGAL